MLDQRLTPEQTVAQMDEAGVEKLMLAAWCRPEGWVTSNDDVAEYSCAFPDRFVGVATVDLSKPVAAVRELERAVHELGCKALRIVPWLWKMPGGYSSCKLHTSHQVLLSCGWRRGSHLGFAMASAPAMATRGWSQPFWLGHQPE